MTSQLHQPWHGTDDEARQETFHGPAHWLATPCPRSELAFSGLVAAGAVGVTALLWSRGAGEAIGLGLLTLAFAAFCAAPSVWTIRHPDQAGRNMAASREYNRSRWRKHPLGVAAGLVIFGFVNGFIRINDAGIGGRFVGGAASAGLLAIFSAIAIWHARRTAKDQS
jgi:hypothetical protein